MYFCKTLYMFQTAFPPIIWSPNLQIQCQVFVRPIMLPAASLARLAAGSSIALINTWRSTCSFDLLMMDGKIVWNMSSFLQKYINCETSHLVGCILRIVQIANCVILYQPVAFNYVGNLNIFFAMVRQPVVSLGLLIIEVSRSHSDTPHSARLLWASDRLNAQTSTWQHTTITRDGASCSQQDSKPQSHKANDRRPPF